MAQSSSAAAALGGLGKFTELRQRLVFVVLALIVYRIGSYIPVPGIDPQRMLELMESQQQQSQNYVIVYYDDMIDVVLEDNYYRRFFSAYC